MEKAIRETRRVDGGDGGEGDGGIVPGRLHKGETLLIHRGSGN